MIINITLVTVLKNSLFTIHNKSFDMIFLEIGFIEKMRTTWGNIHYTGVSNLVAPLLSSTRIYLTRLTPYHWQSRISNFCEIITKGWFCKFFAKYRASSCLFHTKIVNLKNFSENKQRQIQYSARNFSKSFYSKVAKVQDTEFPMVRSQTN